MGMGGGGPQLTSPLRERARERAPLRGTPPHTRSLSLSVSHGHSDEELSPRAPTRTPDQIGPRAPRAQPCFRSRPRRAGHRLTRRRRTTRRSEDGARSRTRICFPVRDSGRDAAAATGCKTERLSTCFEFESGCGNGAKVRLTSGFQPPTCLGLLAHRCYLCAACAAAVALLRHFGIGGAETALPFQSATFLCLCYNSTGERAGGETATVRVSVAAGASLQLLMQISFACSCSSVRALTAVPAAL